MFDCSDGSDENVCEPLMIDEKKYRKTFPPFYGKQRTQINISIAIYSIENIDELAKTFVAEIRVKLRWRDQRITFKNLDKSKKALSKVWHEKIWLPPLYFSNTKENKPILEGRPLDVNVITKSEPILNEISEVDESNVFKGDDNDLELLSKNELAFKCLFDLSRFPFDIQYCSIIVKIPLELRNYTTLKLIDLTYSGLQFIFTVMFSMRYVCIFIFFLHFVIFRHEGIESIHCKRFCLFSRV